MRNDHDEKLRDFSHFVLLEDHDQTEDEKQQAMSDVSEHDSEQEGKSHSSEK